MRKVYDFDSSPRIRVGSVTGQLVQQSSVVHFDFRELVFVVVFEGVVGVEFVEGLGPGGVQGGRRGEHPLGGGHAGERHGGELAEGGPARGHLPAEAGAVHAVHGVDGAAAGQGLRRPTRSATSAGLFFFFTPAAN